jgi:hypothetical protein
MSLFFLLFRDSISEIILFDGGFFNENLVFSN